MNIWLVNHFALPPTGSGPNRHHAMALRLAARGHDVTVVASGFEHYSRRRRMGRGSPIQVEVAGGVRYVWIRTPPYQGMAGRVRNIATFALRLAWHGPRIPVPAPVVIVGSSPHLLTPLGAFVVARRLGVPFVLEVRDIWPQSLVDLLGMSSRNPLVVALRSLERYLYRHADQVVTVLPAAADYLVERGASRSGVSWIPNGVDLSTVPDPGDPPDVAPFVAMYAGTLGLVNGLDLVLDSARVLLDRGIGPDEIVIRMMGPGPARERLEERVHEEGLDNVQIEGPVPKEQVHERLAEAHAFLMVLDDSPVFQYGVSPNKLFDYFAAARPVLFAVRTVVNPVADAGAGVTVRPGDPASMADGLEELAAMTPADRRILGERGAAFVRDSHDYDVLAGQLDSVLAGVVASAGIRQGRTVEP